MALILARRDGAPCACAEPEVSMLVLSSLRPSNWNAPPTFRPPCWPRTAAEGSDQHQV